MKVLCVDDSTAMRRIIQGAVEVLGLGFLGARNAQDAWALLEEQSGEIALITLDWNMPEVTGYELLQKIKAEERFKELPVLMITAESERRNITDAIKAGAKHYLTKPFSQEDLTARMLEALGMGEL
ncbi:MAG: hypothetical protein BWZ10_00910 [candidate division BRC1 bacterium ADurb.BinA364]|nr:MAG: hypothetical protein BWZ10_00910 [candidate division BRC1 bacterium ADurb.BinA364]